MNVDSALIEALIYVSLIIFSPAFFAISRIATRQILNRFFSDEEIIVTVKRNGVVVDVQRIKNAGYLIDHLEALQGEV